MHYRYQPKLTQNPLPTAMNPTALARLRSVLQTHVDQGLLPGAVALIHHQGHTVLHTAVGHTC